MELIQIPQALMVFYGALVLGCGAVLGGIVARNVFPRRGLPSPQPPDQLERRVAQLEQELAQTLTELKQLSDERAFLRELNQPKLPGRKHEDRLRRSAA